MKPKPFMVLKNLTVPVALSPVSCALRRPLLDRNHVADNLQVGGRNLAAAIDQIELQLLAFGKALEPGAFHLADMDEHVLAAFVALDEAKALVGIEELHLPLAGADDLRGHSAAASATTAGSARATRAAAKSPAISATGKTIPSARAISTAEAVAAAKAISAAELRCSAIGKWIEALLAESIPLVAPPAATPSIVTHLTNAPSFRPHVTLGCVDEVAPNGLRRRSPRIIAAIYSAK